MDDFMKAFESFDSECEKLHSSIVMSEYLPGMEATSAEFGDDMNDDYNTDINEHPDLKADKKAKDPQKYTLKARITKLWMQLFILADKIWNKIKDGAAFVARAVKKFFTGIKNAPNAVSEAMKNRAAAADKKFAEMQKAALEARTDLGRIMQLVESVMAHPAAAVRAEVAKLRERQAARAAAVNNTEEPKAAAESWIPAMEADEATESGQEAKKRKFFDLSGLKRRAQSAGDAAVDANETAEKCSRGIRAKIETILNKRKSQANSNPDDVDTKEDNEKQSVLHSLLGIVTSIGAFVKALPAKIASAFRSVFGRKSEEGGDEKTQTANEAMGAFISACESCGAGPDSDLAFAC